VIADKTYTINGNTIVVSVIGTQTIPPIYQVTATHQLSGKSWTHNYTAGPAEIGTNPNIPLAQLQADLDNARQDAANHVAFALNIEAMEAGLV